MLFFLHNHFFQGPLESTVLTSTLNLRSRKCDETRVSSETIGKFRKSNFQYLQFFGTRIQTNDEQWQNILAIYA